jgi:hypothetical protein
MVGYVGCRGGCLRRRRVTFTRLVRTLVAAVDELTGARHSVLDLLEREER